MGIVGGPAAWLAADMADTSRWMHTLTPQELADVDQALKKTLAAGHTCATATREDFPLDAMLPRLQWVLEGIEHDTGIRVLRGLPVQRYTKEQVRLLYWCIGLHMGVQVSQSRQGDLLGDVRNFGVLTTSARGRGYTSKEKLNFHTDSCDVVCLIVIQTARSGGRSMIVSSVAIHDEIARTRPDLLEVLYQPFYWSWQEQEPEGALPYYQQPLYSMEQGYFSSRYIRGHLRSAQRYDEVPRFTELQLEAMDTIDRLAHDERFCLNMMFEPGDMQFLNNHITYHARTEFEDWPEEERRRHLLRMWLSVPNSRPLSPAMGVIYQDRRPGATRGGFPSRVGTHVYETRGGEV
ncbi:MAG: hypothetical protein RI988_2144 [Pseudomonadota bacterium]